MKENQLIRRRTLKHIVVIWKGEPAWVLGKWNEDAYSLRGIKNPNWREDIEAGRVIELEPSFFVLLTEELRTYAEYVCPLKLTMEKSDTST